MVLHHVLAGSGAPLPGVIANGAKSGGPDAYVYAKGDKASAGVASTVGSSPSEDFAPTA